MSRSQSFFRPVPVESPIHRLAPETKVLGGIVISIGLVFNPLWSHVLVAAGLVIAVFIMANLPRSVLPKIPLIVRFALFGGAILITNGIIGLYVARIYYEIKGRPRYIIREIFDREDKAKSAK